MKNKHLYLLLLILGTSFWGISFVFVKSGIGEGSPFIFLFYKFILAATALAIVFHKQLKLITLKTVRISLLIGVPLLAGTIFQTIGLKYTSVSNAAFITGLDVLLIPILKFFVYKKKVAPKIFGACALALAGLYIIVAKDGLALNSGDIWIILCALGFAFYVLQVGRFSTEEKPMPSVILMMAFCGAGCLFCSLIDGNIVWIPQQKTFWEGILFSSLLATAYMYTVQNYAQRYLAEEKVALTYLCEPVFATLAGIVLLNEQFTFNILIGGSLIFSAMIIAELDFKKYRFIQRKGS